MCFKIKHDAFGMVNGLERGQNRNGQTRMEAIVEISSKRMVTD